MAKQKDTAAGLEIGRLTEALASKTALLETIEARLDRQSEELLRAREELAQATCKIAQLASSDDLTGLKSRRAFHDDLQREWERSRRNRHALSLIIIDIDGFRDYNDRGGFDAGDTVLRGIAAAVTATARSVDTTARYGGDEFAVIAPNTARAGAIRLAERLRSAVMAALVPDCDVTVSVGVATTARSIISATDLIAACESALFFSKRDGRNRSTHAADVLP